MKKTISRIWGVGLTLIMVVSLLMWTAPVAADTLEWDDEDEPEEFEAIDIEDMAVSAGGVAIYVVTGDTTLYISGDTGESWEDATVIEDPNLTHTVLYPIACAVAPDDPQYLAVVAANSTVYITEDSGATWDSLGDADPGLTAYDIAVSKESGDSRFVAVAGDGTGSEVWYFEVGALSPSWEQISVAASYPGFDDGDIAGAVEFSPNFDSDEILAVVTYDDADDTNYFQVFSFNTETWNDDVGGFSGYPIDLAAEGGVADGLSAADIAMSPDYLGSDDDLRQVFVGIAGDVGDADDTDGIFFCDDDDAEALEYGEMIHSVDFDGTNLVAGSHNGTTVFYSSDPLEGEDADVDSSSSSKSPGGENECVAAFANDMVVAGTVGDESAFAVSEDMGDNFNDITLIDGGIDATGMLDFAISADGSVQYLLTANTTVANNVSLWRLDNDLWNRVRFLDAYTGTVANLIIRIAPDDPDVVYLAEVGATTIYYSSDGGQTKWHNRTSRYPINDLAVETDGGVAYVLTTSGYVSKSTNTGFTWGSKETSGQAGDYSITSLGEDLLLIGGDEDNPSVSYSTDGNESWTDLDPVDESGNVSVCAEGLSDGDYLWASTDENDSTIYWLELGEDDWEDDLGALTQDQACTGIALADGILYVLSSNGTDSLLTRFLDPWGDEEGDESTAAAAGIDFGATPSALRVSAGSTNLWAVDKASADYFNYEDTIAMDGPTLKSPASGFTVPMNEISGDPNNVNLVWESPSDEITQFEFDLAFDEDFDEDSGFGVTLDADTYDEGDTVNDVVLGSNLVPGATYYWRVKVVGPVESPWSEVRSFTVEEAEAMPAVEVEVPPAPEVKVEMPAPEVKVTVPPTVTVPPAPAPVAPAYIWGIIVIGALLVVALIVLILRTRRVT
jgi:hypothetical protein